MDAYSQLRAEAKRIRDQAIAKARSDYQRALAEIDRLGRKLNGTSVKHRYTASLRGNGTDIRSMTTIRAAELVLRECGPMTLVEIVVELQKRGHRSGDHPKRVKKAVRNGMDYHAELFVRVDGVKWKINRHPHQS